MMMMKQAQLSKQEQLVDQNYSNEIMLNLISALENLAWYYGYKGKKIFDYYSGYAHKNSENELINAVIIQLEVFRASSNNYYSIYSSYDFPKNLTKEQIIHIIQEWKKKIPKEIHIFYEEIIQYLIGKTDVSGISDIIETKKQEWGPTSEEDLRRVGRSAPFINTRMHNQMKQVKQGYNQNGDYEIMAHLNQNQGDDVEMRDCYNNDQQYVEQKKKFLSMETKIEKIFENLKNGTIIAVEIEWLTNNIQFFESYMNGIDLDENIAKQKINIYENYLKAILEKSKNDKDKKFFNGIVTQLIQCYKKHVKKSNQGV